MEKGSYETAAQIQKPTIEAIQETKATVVNPVQQSTTQIKEIHKVFKNVPYDLVKSGQTFSSPSLGRFDIWQFNSNSKSNTGKLVIFSKDTSEGIFFINKLDIPPVEITEGLNEILFNNAEDTSVITKEDVAQWINIIQVCGLGSSYKSSRLYKNLKPLHTNTSYSVEESKEGEALPALVVPSDPDQLMKELELQLAATLAGNNGTFNYVNALLKEMLKQKLIKSKDYRVILKNYLSLVNRVQDFIH